MPPKARIPAPIDRPLSRAYLRAFSGWSTAEPPGVSDPTSLRIMENVMVNRDGSCRVRPGLRYLSYSQAPFTPIPIPTVTPTYVGKNKVVGNQSQIGLPAGTQDGDLVVLSVMCGFTGTAACTDSRMELIHLDTQGARSIGVWCGYASDVGAPLEIHLEKDGTPYGQFSVALVSVFRGAQGRLEYVKSSKVVTANSTSTTAQLPAMSGADQSGVLAVYHTSAGIGGVYNDQDWTKAPAYTMVADGDDSYVEADHAVAVGAAVAAQTTPNQDGSIVFWRAILIQLQGDSRSSSGEEHGRGVAQSLVGTHEPFYLNDGTKAYLLAVREDNGTVGFRALVHDVNYSTMYELDDPLIEFDIPQGFDVLNFTGDTTYVKYLQIDNKIFALSDNGEPMRVFTVGAHKEAKALAAIVRPEWENDDKLTVVHPVDTWINGVPTGTRRNKVPNPSFEKSQTGWSAGDFTKISRPAELPMTPQSGTRALKLESLPTRTNLMTAPLHDLATWGLEGWTSDVGLIVDGTYMKVQIPATKGEYFARSRIIPEIDAGESYKIAYDSDISTHVDPRCKVQFYGVNDVALNDPFIFDVDHATGRWVSDSFKAPKGAVTAKVWIGGENTQAATTYVRAKNVMLCQADESTAMFTGASGANYYWTGATYGSASVYHPAQTISVSTDLIPVKPNKAHSANVYGRARSTARNATLSMRLYDKNSKFISAQTSAVTSIPTAWTRLAANSAGIPATATQAKLLWTVFAVPRGESHYIDAAMLEPLVSTPGTYFDGSTNDTTTIIRDWVGEKHNSASIEETYAAPRTAPTAATRTADTLIALGGPAVNIYQFGFFYTFSNEVGESAASKITIRRTQRDWSSWIWETPNAATEPSGTSTNNPKACADQLVAIMPQDVWDEAVAEGATSWSLYMFSWSDQDAVPVTALKVGSRNIEPDSTYDLAGWIRVTPDMSGATDIASIPSPTTLYNYSNPSHGGNGLVAADRMILVYDPTSPAVIRWSSNQVGEYTNFTANKGGGYKTLTSGNLYVPAAVVLWQNPQSADTLCILCLGTDGKSASYYMAPATVSAQSESVNVMGFEETTATPGTTSPYGVEIFNNSLYHPLDDQLMKSTASNYNINHKSQTDLIRNMWEKLRTKEWIMSSQHDGRLYFIVNNPEGEPVETNCKGNEIWVYDATAKTGTWSRYLIHAHAIRKIEFGGQIYMSVIRPDGVYYLDPSYGLDDYVAEDLAVESRAIPWSLETNTQGANRAHDAWAHLQLVSINLGYWQGRLKFGIRGVDINGRDLDISKISRDEDDPSALAWDIEEILQVRRDMKEWFFYAESVVDDAGATEPSYGQLSLVQYRYTPSSVNTGYESGSVETFEYGRDLARAESTTTANGVPLPLADSRRP
jgi:hypothetical protein